MACSCADHPRELLDAALVPEVARQLAEAFGIEIATMGAVVAQRLRAEVEGAFCQATTVTLTGTSNVPVRVADLLGIGSAETALVTMLAVVSSEPCSITLPPPGGSIPIPVPALVLPSLALRVRGTDRIDVVADQATTVTLVLSGRAAV